MKVSNLVKSVVLGLALTSTISFADTYQLSPKSSEIEWQGSKVIGDSHKGNLQFSSGSLNYEGNKPKSAVFVVDMMSLTNTDLKDKEWNDKLVGHLKSDDFFSVAKYPEAKLVINEFKSVDNSKYKAEGVLTVKGKSEPVSIDLEIGEASKGGLTLSSNFSFDRTDFDVRYGSGKFFENLGDKMISDDVKIKTKAVLNKKVNKS